MGSSMARALLGAVHQRVGFLTTATGMAISAACFPTPLLIKLPADLLCRGALGVVGQHLVCKSGGGL